jgi:hypothetical protein
MNSEKGTSRPAGRLRTTLIVLVSVVILAVAAYLGIRGLTLGSVAAAPLSPAAAHNPVNAANDAGASQPVFSSAANPAADQPRSLDLGDGYTLQLNASSGQVVAPEARPQPAQPDQPAAAQLYTQKQDLGDGYTLYSGPTGGQIVAPASNSQATSAATTTTVTDIGGGYILVTGPDGGGVMKR